MAAICLGRADRAFRVALEWAADREQFGQKIGKFQAVSFKLADLVKPSIGPAAVTGTLALACTGAVSLESAVAVSGRASSFTAVSQCTARAWAGTVDARPVLNGVDTRAWQPGPGGGPVVWSGRLVREKAPPLAIDAARLAGREIVLAGPVQDRRYVDECSLPRLGPDARLAGHLDHRRLARLLGRASVAVVTPAWEEPYGLVAAEAMSCGTPVAAFARGALPEIVADGTGVLAGPDDVAGLAAAIDAAAGCDRRAVRRHAVEQLSAHRMVEDYEQVYASLVQQEVAA